jgi:16S rRNA (adenine1518-N6/adenine1519-N6)-dimethyltransferase
MSNTASRRNEDRLAAMSHIARKRFGQHFLTDDAIIDSIARIINPKPGEAVVEIGPGLGALTRPLQALCGALTVIELDRDLAAKLRRQPELTVVESDVLKVDFAALADQAGRKLRVVGNLPYNISTPILFHLLEASAHIEDQHFMLQKEVVERMCATPGNKDYGRLTVMLQWRYAIESVLDVPPTAFEPPPRVNSAVVRMQPLTADAAVDSQRLSALVAVAFSQRRKILRHTLGRWIQEQGITMPFDLQRRAEEVPVAEYLALAKRPA